MKSHPKSDHAVGSTTDRRALLAGIGGLAAGTLLSAGRAEARPPEPPGAPSPTMKRLDEVEPRIAINAANTPGSSNAIHRILQPGSYYLTGDVVGESGKDGIRIEASDVSIDLMGFTLRGVEGSVRGIRTNGTRNNLAIRNGGITGWGSAGISLTVGGNGMNSILEQLVISSNGAEGIRANRNAIVRCCTAHDNTTVGIVAAQNATISDCSARGNGGAGIACNQGSTVVNCSSRENGDQGIEAIGRGCVISHCAADSNAGCGIETSDECLVQQCVSRNNGLDGIVVGAGATVKDCVVSRNNLESEEGAGILTSSGCVVSNCSVSHCLVGIVTGSDSNINGCSCSRNPVHGILANGRCIIRGNTCSFSDGTNESSGIIVILSGSRVEGNNCASCSRGISVLTPGNVVVSNSVSQPGFVPYIIANGNAFGELISTNSVVNSSNAWANLHVP